MWNQTTIKQAGEAVLDLKNPKTVIVTRVSLFVVNNNFNCLLGLQTVKEMDLITVNAESFIAYVAKGESFQGDLGYASLTIDHTIKPKILPCRKIPIALHDQVKSELDNIVVTALYRPSVSLLIGSVKWPL